MVPPPLLSPVPSDSLAALVRARDPDRFLTALFAPPPRREALLTLYAFASELDRAIAVTSEPHLALIRLHWWREVVEGARKPHEAATPLTALLDRGMLTPELLLPVMEAWETEAEPAIETMDAWRAWQLAGAGGLAVAAAYLLGAREPETARGPGAAHGVARTLRWNATLAARGRCLLPVDVLAAEGVTREEAIAAPSAAPVQAVLRRLAAEGEAFLKQSPRVPVSRAMVAAFLPGVLARRDLRGPFPARPAPRGLGDRLAVMAAGLTGQV